MLKQHCSVGMQVYFGRQKGEKTLGEIVKLNPRKAKVKQLESRGTLKSHPVGTIWTVPYELIEPATHEDRGDYFQVQLRDMIAEVAAREGTGRQQALRDVLTDLRHVADSEGLDFDGAVVGSADVYMEELAEGELARGIA